MGVAVGSGTVLAVIEQAFVLCCMHDLAPFEAQDEVVVGFIEVNNTKAMDLRVAGFFLEHYIDYSAPAVEGVSMMEGVIGHCKVSQADG